MTAALSAEPIASGSKKTTQTIAVVGSGAHFIEVAHALSQLDTFQVNTASLTPFDGEGLTVSRTVGQAVGSAEVTVLVTQSPEDLHALLLGRGAAAVSGQQNTLFVDLSVVPAEVTSLCARRVATLRKRYVNLSRANVEHLVDDDRFKDGANLLAALQNLSYAGV